MAHTASTQIEGVTFTPAQADVADRVERAEQVLYQWACGRQTAADVRRILKANGIHLMDRLDPRGLPRMDAEVDGFGPITLTF